MTCATQRKGVIFILDGLGDYANPKLRDMTPLQAAATPVLDALAARNQCGLMDPVQPGRTVETHTGVGILFGMPAEDAMRLQRGPIEAAGVNLQLQAGDVLWRANLASVMRDGDELRVLDRRAGRIREHTDALCEALQGLRLTPDITADLFAATQHRAVLRLRGRGVSAEVGDTDPGEDGRPVLQCKARAESEDAKRTADAVNRFTLRAHEILSTHAVNAMRAAAGLPAANGVLLRGAGVHRVVKSRLAGYKVAVVAGERTILGLASLLGFTGITDSRFTALPDTDLAAKLQAAGEALQRHDLVFVHIKGTDTAAHDRDPVGKAEFIARFDRELGESVIATAGDVALAVCADHCTDSRSGEHSGDAVPVLLCGGSADSAVAYNEAACAEGGLGRVTGEEFLGEVLRLLTPP